MDFGAYVRVSHCIQYSRITGFYAPPDDRVVEARAVDMPVSAESREAW